MALTREIIDRSLGSPLGAAGLEVVELLQSKGYEAYWVGGALRDMFLGRLPQDIDIATGAQPNQVCELFRKYDDSASSLGTIIVSLHGFEFEVTTFREDIGIRNQRKPEKVQFVDRKRDSRRRDFTVNAMYWNPVSGELIDDFDGEKDMTERLVRFIGDPDSRISEDALRILRGVRLRSAIDGQYDVETYKAMQSHAAEAAHLSGPRILSELDRMLLTSLPGRALEDLWELGVLKAICPELHACKGVPQPVEYHQEGDVWDHLLQCVSASTEDHKLDVRLAALFHDCGKSITFSVKERIRFDEHASASADLCTQVLNRWQCPKARVQKIDWLIRHHMMMGTFAEMPEERKAHWYYHPWFTELLQLFWLDVAGTKPAVFSLYDEVIADYNAFLDSHPRPPKPLLSGERVMELLGIRPGALVGEILSTLYDLQVHKKITTKKEAEEFVKRYTGSVGQ